MFDEIIETHTGKTWLGEDGIIRLIYFPNAEITLAEAKENVAATNAMRKGQKHPLLIDMSKIRSLDREARQYFAQQKEMKPMSAVAILVDSPLSRIIGNFFMTLHPGTERRRLFTSETEAIAWLQGFLP